MSDEQLLRDRMHAEVTSVDLPPGLADRVQTGARRRRRARLATAGVAAVATAATVLGVVAVLPDRPPARVATPAPSCPLPAPATGAERGPAPAGTDISGWGFRGDPALKELVRRYGGTKAAEVVPLLAQPLSPPATPGATEMMWAFAERMNGSWWLQVGSASGKPGKVDSADVSMESLRPLPAPVSGAQVSVIVHRELMNNPQQRETLVALAPPGTGTVAYRACAGDGDPPEVVARGDALLVLRLGNVPAPQPARGLLTVTGADGAPVYSGRVDDWSPDVRRAVMPWPVEKPVADGKTHVGASVWDLRLTASGQRAVIGGDDGGRPEVFQTVVMAGCLGEGSAAVEVRGRSAPMPCDGQRHEVYRGPFDFAGDAVTVVGKGTEANLWAHVSVQQLS